MAMKTCEITLIVDATGTYAVGIDFDNAAENYDNEIGGGQARRVITIKATLALPENIEVAVTVPDEAGHTVAVEAA